MSVNHAREQNSQHTSFHLGAAIHPNMEEALHLRKLDWQEMIALHSKYVTSGLEWHTMQTGYSRVTTNSNIQPRLMV